MWGNNLDALSDIAEQFDRHGNVGTRSNKGAKRGANRAFFDGHKSIRNKLRQMLASDATRRRKKMGV